MKHRHVIEIITEDQLEEHFIMNKFPDAWWNPTKKGTIFYIQVSESKRVQEAFREFEQVKNKLNEGD